MTTISSPLNLALRDHAVDLDSTPTRTDTLATHLDRTTLDSDRLIDAALLHVWWGPAGDHLHAALTAVSAADYELAFCVEHDAICRCPDFGQCDTCDGIREDALSDALGGLRALLGDAVCADLTAAVTA